MALTIGVGQWEEIAAIAVIVLGLNLFVSLAVIIFIKLDFTILKQNKNEIIILHYRKNRIETYNGPVLGKPKATIIKLPNEWIKEIKGGEIKLIEAELKIEMNALNTIVIPLVMEYKFLGPFKIADFQKKLKITTPRKSKVRYFSALHMFNPTICDLHVESLKMDIVRWDNGLISFLELAPKIISQIDFSEKYFSNIRKIKVEVGTPKIIVKFKK